MEYPEIDRYASLNSPLHRFDPRIKIISFIVLIFSIVLLPAVRLALVGLIASILLLLLSNLPIRFVLQHVRWVFLFIIPFLLVMPFTVKGNEVLHVGGLSVTSEGLEFGFLVSIRALAAVLLIFPMIGTMRFDITLKALYQLRVPSLLIQMLMFTYRYIFIFIDEFSRMQRSMMSRGFRVGTNRHTLTTIGRAVGMLLVRSYERAERVYQAMLSAGYTGNPRTLFESRSSPKDYIYGFIIIGFAVLLHVPVVIQ